MPPVREERGSTTTSIQKNPGSHPDWSVFQNPYLQQRFHNGDFMFCIYLGVFCCGRLSNTKHNYVEFFKLYFYSDKNIYNLAQFKCKLFYQPHFKNYISKFIKSIIQRKLHMQPLLVIVLKYAQNYKIHNVFRQAFVQQDKLQ